MIAIHDSWFIQIEVTNACHFRCANCTRLLGHQKKPYFMPIEQIEKAIDSLEGYEGGIGIMGGEPTMHPQFLAICELMRKKVGPWRSALWTSGFKWKEYRDVIKKTFLYGVSYNDHSSPEQSHQPILVAIDDVMTDKKLMRELIDDCWIQRCWAPSINPKGGFFCEVAAAMDLTFQGPGGYPLEPGWFKKTPEQFRDQVERYCKRCSAAMPYPKVSRTGKDLISQSNYDTLAALGSPKIKAGSYELVTGTMDEEIKAVLKKGWNPATYLDGKQQKMPAWLIFIMGYVNEFRRKKDLQVSEWWLLLRGGYNPYRAFFKIRRSLRRLFRRTP